MKYRNIFTIAIVFVFITAGLIAQEISGVTMGFTVSNGKGRSQYLELGVKQGATSGIDPQLGETELPPLPPSQIFDVRFQDNIVHDRVSGRRRSKLGQHRMGRAVPGKNHEGRHRWN